MSKNIHKAPAIKLHGIFACQIPCAWILIMLSAFQMEILKHLTEKQL